MSWIRNHFDRPTPAKAQAAIDMASEVAHQAKSLREQLEPFRLEDDPFAAINIKKAMSDTHENIVEFDKTPRAEWK